MFSALAEESSELLRDLLYIHKNQVEISGYGTQASIPKRHQYAWSLKPTNLNHELSGKVLTNDCSCIPSDIIGKPNKRM